MLCHQPFSNGTINEYESGRLTFIVPTTTTTDDEDAALIIEYSDICWISLNVFEQESYVDYGAMAACNLFCGGGTINNKEKLILDMHISIHVHGVSFLVFNMDSKQLILQNSS